MIRLPSSRTIGSSSRSSGCARLSRCPDHRSTSGRPAHRRPANALMPSWVRSSSRFMRDHVERMGFLGCSASSTVVAFGSPDRGLLGSCEPTAYTRGPRTPEMETLPPRWRPDARLVEPRLRRHQPERKMGRGFHRVPDRRRQTVPRRDPRSVPSRHRWMGHQRHPRHRAGRVRVNDGARSYRRTRSGHSSCRSRLAGRIQLVVATS